MKPKLQKRGHTQFRPCYCISLISLELLKLLKKKKKSQKLLSLFFDVITCMRPWHHLVYWDFCVLRIMTKSSWSTAPGWELLRNTAVSNTTESARIPQHPAPGNDDSQRWNAHGTSVQASGSHQIHKHFSILTAYLYPFQSNYFF